MGSHFTVEVGDVSVIVVRGEDGRVRGLFNHCTHQNARLCSSSRPDLSRLSRGGDLRRAIDGGQAKADGQTASPASPPSSPPPAPAAPAKLQTGPTCGQSQRLICPFHHWTFSLSGEHLAPRTALTADPAQRLHFALTPVRAAWEVSGLVLLDCTRRPPTAATEGMSAATLWEDGEGEEQWRALQRTVEGRTLRTGGSLVVERNWKAVWASLMREEGRAVGLFPSLVCRAEEGGRTWLLQLLPLTPQQTAVTALEVGEVQTEGERDSEEEVADDLATAVRGWLTEADEEGLAGRDRAAYERWMVEGLRCEVEKEESGRREYERRRNKVLGLS